MFDMASTMATPNSKLALVLVWYSDQLDESSNVEDYAAELSDIIALLPSIVAREWAVFRKADLFFIYDALGSYPERDDGLESLYQSVTEAWSRAAKNLKTVGADI